MEQASKGRLLLSFLMGSAHHVLSMHPLGIALVFGRPQLFDRYFYV